MGINVPNLQGLASTLPDEVQKALGGVLRAQDKLNRDISQMLPGTIGPQAPEFQNGWEDFGGNTKSRFWLLPFGVVHLSLTMRNGNIGDIAFVLPESHRPTYDVTDVAYTDQAGNEAGKLVVYSNGNVVPITGSNTLFALEMSWMVR